MSGCDKSPNSPPCSMHEADDVYMGYLGRDALAGRLNELLEAERAGSRVTLETARTVDSGAIAALMTTIQQDEARWCAMLTEHIEALGESPSSKTGGFHQKAMAITDIAERTAFLNRGQAWVVRKLEEMLPRVRADQLHADLTEMLRAHERNIALTETLMQTRP